MSVCTSDAKRGCVLFVCSSMLCPIGTELVGSRNDSHTSESEEEETEKGGGREGGRWEGESDRRREEGRDGGAGREGDIEEGAETMSEGRMEEGGKWREMGKAAYTCTCRKHRRGERCKLHMCRGWMDGEN